MKREINMRSNCKDKNGEQGSVIKGSPDVKTDSKIDTDPFGSWTGVSTEDPYDKPVQDVDDL